MLREVLNNKEIVNGIVTNLGYKKEIENIVNQIKSTKKNNIIEKFTVNEKSYSLEILLLYSIEKKEYLLDCRLFDELDDIMIGSYLDVLNKY